jgi:hypothetical protein
MHRCLANLYYFIRTGNRSRKTLITIGYHLSPADVPITWEGLGLHIKKMSQTGISYLNSNPLQLSPYDLFGNLLIVAGIIILLIGSYRQKNSPTY